MRVLGVWSPQYTEAEIGRRADTWLLQIVIKHQNYAGSDKPLWTS